MMRPSTFTANITNWKTPSLLPRPARPGGPPILIGGNGPKRTLPLVAKYADEWNADALDLETYRARRATLGDYLAAEGRSLDDIKCSLMTRVIYRQTQAQLDAFLHESGVSDDDLAAGKMIVGTAAEVVDQIGARAEAGVERIMLRWLELDDMANLECLRAMCCRSFRILVAKRVLLHHRGHEETQRAQRNGFALQFTRRFMPWRR